MLKKIAFSASACIALALIVIPVSSVRATTTDALQAQIAALLATISQLQTQITAMNGQSLQVQSALKLGLHQGMTDEDVKKIQEILATDPSLYPQGLITGYFGPLTKDALVRFQQRFGLTGSGEVDSDTQVYLRELLNEQFNGQIPPGLLRAPGIQKKIEMRIKDGCGAHTVAAGLLCTRVTQEQGAGTTDNQGNGGRASTTATTTTILSIKAVLNGAHTHITVIFKDGGTKSFDIPEGARADVVNYLTDTYDQSESRIKDLTTFTDASHEITSLTVKFNSGDSDVTVKYVNGVTNKFTLSTTDHNDVITRISEKLNIDKESVREIVDFTSGALTITVVTESGSSAVDVTFENSAHTHFTVHSADKTLIKNAVVDQTKLSLTEVENVITFTSK